MYSLLVRAEANSWNQKPYELERGRAAREFTSEALQARFATFDGRAIEELMNFPALFAYEQFNDLPARVGWITGVRANARAVQIRYEFEPSLAPISSTALAKLNWELDFNDWEMNRTHWAIKEADLLPALIDAGLVDKDAIRALPKDSRPVRLGFEKSVTEVEARPLVFRVPSSRPENDLVSVMMPFTAEFNGVHAALRRACASVKLRCQRVDEIWQDSEVIQDVFSLIYRSTAVVCDFSGRNPNVFYEAGIAHTLGRPVIPIVQNEGDMPFDLRHHRYLRYLNNGEGLAALTDQVTQRLSTLVSR